MRLSEALAVFLEDYVWFRGYAESTGKNYKLAVNSFIITNGNLELSEITLSHIKSWKREMESSKRDNNGIVSYMYKMRLFLRWCIKKYGLELDLDEWLIPKLTKKIVNYLDPDEIDKLINSVPPNRFRHNELRNKAILAMFYSSGIRLGELQRIKLRDIRGDEFKVRGKGNKERTAFIDVRAKKAIEDYLYARPIRSEYLFTTSRNKPMDKTSLEKIVRSACHEAGFAQTISPHIIRHSYATHLLQNGMNLRHIQVLLGHADISTTQIYTHVADNDLRAAYKSFHKVTNAN